MKKAVNSKARICVFLALLSGIAYMFFTLTNLAAAGQSKEANAVLSELAPLKSPAVIEPDKLTNKSRTVITTDNTLAKTLEEKIRILCWIAVTNETMDRAAVILETWGRRCTKILLIGDESTTAAENVVRLPVKEGRQRLWPKTREAFRYLYANHLDDADWFLKADTDTYVIMENLRMLLSQRNVEEPAYIGCNIQLYTKNGYNSGGAGYVLNKKSITKLVTTAFNDSHCERGLMEDEDVSLGYCLGVVDITPGDPTDENGKNRFFPFEPADHIDHEPMRGNIWYWKATFKPGPKSMDCCSETVVSFHYVSKQLMWNMEFLLYHVKVFGLSTWFDNTIQSEG